MRLTPVAAAEVFLSSAEHKVYNNNNKNHICVYYIYYNIHISGTTTTTRNWFTFFLRILWQRSFLIGVAYNIVLYRYVTQCRH